MELHFSHFVTFGLLSLLMLLILRSYWNFRKKCSGFPFSHIMPFLIYSHVTGKISKDVPFSNVFFQKLIQTGKQHMKEELFMTYLTRPTIFLFNAEAMKLFSNEKAAADKSLEYKMVEEFMGAGVVTSNGERWRTHRKMINPVFHMSMLKEKVSLLNEHGLALVKDMEKLAAKPSVDILKILKCHHFYALSESILGLKQNKENEAQLLKMAEIVDRLCDATVKRFCYPFFRPRFLLQCFPFGIQFFRQINEIDNFISNVIFEMKEHVISKKTINAESFGIHLRKSLTYILLDRHLNDPSFTFKDLHDEVKTMIGTGYDTISITNMWCLFLLGLHPEIQENVFKEILSTTSDYITYEECSNLVYLESVIMETLRIYPTVPAFSRNISGNIKFGKYELLKDTTIAFFPYLSNRDPKFFPDPEKFEPERFLNRDSEILKNFTPFSVGNRSCIGRNYALMEMKIFLSHIVRNFQITSLDKRDDNDLCWEIILTSAKPLRMKITRRHNT